MFGQNPVRPLALKDEPLTVHSIFPTIQGEGPWSGFPAVFIRLSGCNLRCHFCDTEFESGTIMSNSDILKQVYAAYDTFGATLGVTRRIVLTGGEPARQDCTDLIKLLSYNHFAVQVETAGTYFPTWLRATKTVISPKTRNVHKGFYDNVRFSDWKYVLRAGDVSPVDGLPLSCTQVYNPDDTTVDTKELAILSEKHGAPARPPSWAAVWLSPMDEGDEVKNAANRRAVAESCMHFGYRAMLQIHKLMGLD